MTHESKQYGRWKTWFYIKQHCQHIIFRKQSVLIKETDILPEAGVVVVVIIVVVVVVMGIVVVVVVCVLGMTKRTRSIAIIPTRIKTRTSRDIIKQIDEYRQQMGSGYLSATFLKLDKKKMQNNYLLFHLVMYIRRIYIIWLWVSHELSELPVLI